MNKSIGFGIILLLILGGGILYSTVSRSSEQAASVIPAKKVGTSDISRKANDIPPPITRKNNETVVVKLEAEQVVAEIAPGVTYEYWTFNKTAPGPFIRVKEGDTVEVHLSHVHGHDEGHATGDFFHSFSVDSLMPFASAQTNDGHDDGSHPHGDEATDGHQMNAEDMAHMEAGHGEHSIDLHAVMGPGGGAMISKTLPNDTTIFSFKAQRAGIYVYHCASPHIPTHIANGMYGLILVEPKEGLAPVDKEFYVMQADMYTKGIFGQKGHQELDSEKLKNEQPEYFVFNGRVGGVVGDNAITAKSGETIRIFFGVGTHIAANFHIIGGIFDKLYSEGDLLSPPKRNVQTTIVAPGGAMMIETTFDVPGKYLLVDHSLSRAIDKGALGEIIIEGVERPDVLKKIK